MRPLVDPRLRTSIPDHWPSKCTIQTITYTLNSAGQRVPDGGSDVEGLINIPCRLGALIILRPTDTELRDAHVQTVTTNRNLKLNGYYPSIEPRIMQAVVDGVVYPIVGNESDSEHFSTRLRLEDMRP